MKPKRVQTRPCRFCDQPVTQPRNGVLKEFCDSRHRAAYREQQHQVAIQAMNDALDGLDEAVARVNGARAQLARFARRKGI